MTRSIILVGFLLLAGCGGSGSAATQPPVVATPAPAQAATPAPTLSDAAYLWCSDATSGNISRVVDAAVRLKLIHGVITDDRDRAFTHVFGQSRAEALANADFVRACTAAYESR